MHQEVCYTSICTESLNSDGQQLHQYQQKQQSPLISTEFTEHKETTTCDVRNPDQCLFILV
jgi:hypothetical protein